MTPEMPPRDLLLHLFEAGVRAADPAGAVRRAWAEAPPHPTHILALGKAAIPMAQAALALAPGAAALVVTNPENARDLAGARVLLGEHPVPGSGSAQAGGAVLDFVAQLAAGDHLLALISGGASALVVAPVAGVSLEEKAAFSRAMLGAGLDITQMNAVRQHLSRLKGGGLARACAAPIISFILSDVIGDDPRAIASGPTQSPLASPEAAREILARAGLWEGAPSGIKAALSRAAPLPVTSPPESSPARIIGSNGLSVQAMAQAASDLAADLRWSAELCALPLEGDVAEAAEVVLARAAGAPGLWLAGGETTVRLRGTGRGGRNQELALRVAQGLAARGLRATFLSGGTDGRDGPTDAAGGLVDQGTWGRIGPEATALLANNDSHRALELAGDLLRIPATGTNVADLQILWISE